MARSLLDIHDREHGNTLERRDNRVGRAAVGALAAALSALMIGSLVVARSEAALTPAGTVTAGSAAAATVSLVEDDQGRSLFDLAEMAPDRPVVHCIEVVYEGTIVPVDLALRAEVGGELARYLDVEIEQGRRGGLHSCAGFAPTATVFRGTLDGLAASGWLELGRLSSSGDRIGYRVSFELRDERGALGRSASSSFVWVATPT
jgi:hypothetical protein